MNKYVRIARRWRSGIVFSCSLPNIDVGNKSYQVLPFYEVEATFNFGYNLHAPKLTFTKSRMRVRPDAEYVGLVKPICCRLYLRRAPMFAASPMHFLQLSRRHATTSRCRASGRNAVAELKEQWNNGLVPVRELTQTSVLAGAASSVEGKLDAVPLELLWDLSKSAVFFDVWVSAGASVLDKLNGKADEGPLPSQVEPSDAANAGVDDMTRSETTASPAPEESAAASIRLDVEAVITHVIPLAFERFEGLIDQVRSGTLLSREACTMFRGSARQVEEEVRLLFSWRVAHILSGGSGPKRAGGRSQDAHQAVVHVKASLAAQASIEWGIIALPGLLRAHTVLHAASRLLAVEGERQGDDSTSPAATAGRVEASGESSVCQEAEATESLSVGIIAVPPAMDPSHAELKRLLTDLQTRRNDLSISEAPVAWKAFEDWPVEATFTGGTNQQSHNRAAQCPGRTLEGCGLHGVCRPHVELLSALSDSPALVDWLLEVHRCSVQAKGRACS